ncbi:MAG: MFS transporter [Bacteroidia bacterium]|jgi:MFS family permease
MTNLAPPPTTARVLWAIPAVYFLFVAAEFVVLTSLSLGLTQAGVSAFAVGALASLFWVGIFVASTRAHAAVVRLGHARTFLAATAASTVAVLSFALHDSYAGWLAGAFALGAGGGLVWVSGESWLAEAAPRERRGFYVGLFETAVGLGMVAGPALLPVALRLDVAPLHLGLALMAAAFAASWPLLRAAEPPADDDGAATGNAVIDWRAVAVPLAAVAALSGLMESGISSLLPSISMRLGFAIDAAAALGAVIGAGSALLQSPFGWLADRTGLPRTMALAWAAIVTATAALLLGAAQPQAVLWPVGFVLGGVGGAVYTLVVIELGHRLAGGGLVKAMSLLVTAYTAGTAGGPALGGWLFDRAGLAGLALALLLLGLCGSVLAWRALRAPAQPMLST